MPISLAELAQRVVDCRLRGAADTVVLGVASLDSAGPGDITFLANPRFRRNLGNTRASVVILGPDDAQRYHGNCLISDNPYVAWARVAAIVRPRQRAEPGIHPTAVIDPGADVSAKACVGPHVVIEDEVTIGPGVEIGAGCWIGRGTRIGPDTRLFANVSVSSAAVIGERCHIDSGAIIGADGFGFANDDGRWLAIPQLGRVCIGNDVSIGACTTIDRGALGDTTIGNGVKLDNHIQIAHNVEVGEHTAMAAFVGIAGSTRIGRRCTFGGRAGVLDHLEVTDDVHVTATTLVTRSLKTAGAYSSVVAPQEVGQWNRNAARFRTLNDMARRLRRVEKMLGNRKTGGAEP